MSILPKETIEVIAQSVGINNLAVDAALTLAPDVEYRMRELMQARDFLFRALLVFFPITLLILIRLAPYSFLSFVVRKLLNVCVIQGELL